MLLTTRPITPSIGAEVTDIDLSTVLAPQVVQCLQATLVKYGVLVFRNQPAMTREAHIALARAFGRTERSAGGEASHPEVVRVVHDRDAPPTENIWHVDHSFRTTPPVGTVLRAVELPNVGGDTLFADMRAVWQRLPHDVRELVGGLRATHDIAKWAPEQRVDELRAAAPITAHPAVRVHPDSGEQILFVNAAYTTSFVGLAATDSATLLDYLLRQVHVPEVQCRVRWEPGMVVVWDNRSVQHYATGDYFPQRRVMERVVIAATPR